MKNCTLLWHEARFRVKMYNTHHVRSTFGSWEFQKLHAAVARSTFSIQNVKKARGSEHFWKLGPLKIACRCGSNHFQDFPSLNQKNLHCQTTFGSWDVPNCGGTSIVVCSFDVRVSVAFDVRAPRAGLVHFRARRCSKAHIL